MQKIFITIALALALTSAFAGYNFTNSSFSKVPVSVISSNDTNFTTASNIILSNLNAASLYIVAQNTTTNLTNTSNSNWAIWFRQLDSKALTAGSVASANFNSSLSIVYSNNYAVAVTKALDSNGFSQVVVYQQSLTGSAPLPRLTLSNNANASFSPAVLGSAIVGTTYYVFYTPQSGKVNVTNFAIGGSIGSGEFTLTSNYTSGLSTAAGSALSSSQVIATWVSNGTLYDSVVDLSKGSVNPSSVSGYNTNLSCIAYSTDKKLYGEICFYSNASSGNISYYVKTGSAGLVSFANYTISTSIPSGLFPYSQYVVVLFTNLTTLTNPSYSYEIWNLDSLNLFKARTQYATTDSTSVTSTVKIPGAGIYTLLYNVPSANSINSIVVGLLLGSSYLTSVLGFLLAIIAGLLLF